MLLLTLEVSAIHLNPSLAHRGKGVNLLKDSSHRKRRKVDVEEVKEEEKELQKDRQGYLYAAKRLKEEVQDMKEEMIVLRHSQELVQKLI